MNHQKRKKDVKQRSLMNTVRHSLRHIRTNKAPKNAGYRRNATPTAITNASYGLNSHSDGSRTPSFVPSFRKEKEKEKEKPLPPFPGDRSRHSTSILHSISKPAAAATKSKAKSKQKATAKAKACSQAKHLLPITVPSLYINKGPNAQQTSFNHLLHNDEQLPLNKAVIAISIDIEALYNEEYDNNYNRKVLGPIQPVQFPIIIDCSCVDISQEDEKDPLSLPRFGRHQKSASMSGSPYIYEAPDATRTRGRTTCRRHKPSQSSPRLDLQFSKRRKEYFDKTTQSPRSNSKPENVSNPMKYFKFEDQYDKINEITPDELEILARKLLREMEEEDAEEDPHGYGYRYVARNADTNKRAQHHHLLHSNVKKKAEAVSFGLQLINSMKQVTSTLMTLMQTFSDGLHDLVGICQQFMELIVEPLPRQVHSDYHDVIHKYKVVWEMMTEMRDGFDQSSHKLKENMPIINRVLSSDISNRIAQYDAYINDMNMADIDIKTLQIHCDRGLRRLFREIPKPQHLMNASFGEPGLLRKKSLKQHKNIRLFGSHYISSNSDEYICRSVPGKVRDGIIHDYIHYLTLMDTMNWNTKQCYNQILPQINVEFEENQTELTQQIDYALRNLHQNLSKFNPKTPKRLLNIRSNNNHDTNIAVRARPKPLAPAKPYTLHRNELMASPMHTYDVIAKINEYVDEESEKKTYDEFEMVKVHKKNFKQQKKQENGKFSLKNYRIHFDSANFINEEVIESFFNNHYYHLGDIMFEIPELYEAFGNYLRMKLSEENLLFLRTVDDAYFNLHNETFNHNTAIQQAKDIWKQFISEKSKNQINIPGNLRKRITNDLKKIHKIKDPLSIFDKAYDGISSLIHKEALPNFYKSAQFLLWYEKARQENEKLWKKERKMMKK